MKQLWTLAAALCLSVTAMAQNKVKPAIPYNAEIEAKVKATLSAMTLDQKIGQMCEITVDVVTDWSNRDAWKVSQDGMKKLFDDYKVGSILNVPLSFAQTPKAWAEGIRQLLQ